MENHSLFVFPPNRLFPFQTKVLSNDFAQGNWQLHHHWYQFLIEYIKKNGGGNWYKGLLERIFSRLTNNLTNTTMRYWPPFVFWSWYWRLHADSIPNKNADRRRITQSWSFSMNEPQNFDVNISNPIRPPFLLPFNLREFEYKWAVKIFSNHFFPRKTVRTWRFKSWRPSRSSCTTGPMSPKKIKINRWNDSHRRMA